MGGDILNTPFWEKVMMGNSAAHVATVSLFAFTLRRIVCDITSKMGKTLAKLLCFVSFAGAWAHHEGLRRLKPCQFQRTVYWHCECDKLRPDARFQLLAVCSSWTKGHRANEPCLSNLQIANMKVSINDGSDWKTFSVLLKPGQRLKEKSYFPGCSAVRFLVVGCLVEVAELLGLLFDFFGQTLHASWRQKSCTTELMKDVFRLFACEVKFAWNSCIVLELVCCLSATSIL